MSTNKPHTDNSENALSKLYSERKQQHKAPPGMEKRLFKASPPRQPWYQSFGRFFKYSALLATIAVVVMVFGIQFLQQKQNPVNYVNIEVHSLTSENTTTLAGTHRINYDNAFNEYMTTLELNTFDDQRIARVIEDSEDGIKLFTCDEEVIQITRALLKNIQSAPNTEIQPNIGDMMALNMDDNGRILQLDTNTDVKGCPALAD